MNVAAIAQANVLFMGFSPVCAFQAAIIPPHPEVQPLQVFKPAMSIFGSDVSLCIQFHPVRHSRQGRGGSQDMESIGITNIDVRRGKSRASIISDKLFALSAIWNFSLVFVLLLTTYKGYNQ